MEKVFYGNISWAKRLDNFVKRHLAQYRENPTAAGAGDGHVGLRCGLAVSRRRRNKTSRRCGRRCDNDARIGEIRLQKQVTAR